MEELIIPSVQLGGRMWQMRIGHKVMQKFSALTRVSMENWEQLFRRYDMSILLLWCIISTQDPTVKREQLDDWIDELSPKEWQRMMTQIIEGIKANFPDEETDGEETEADGAGSGEPDPTGADT